MLQAFKAAGPACLKEEGVCRDGHLWKQSQQGRGGEEGWKWGGGGQGRGSTKGKLRGNRSQTSQPPGGHSGLENCMTIQQNSPIRTSTFQRRPVFLISPDRGDFLGCDYLELPGCRSGVHFSLPSCVYLLLTDLRLLCCSS